MSVSVCGIPFGFPGVQPPICWAYWSSPAGDLAYTEQPIQQIHVSGHAGEDPACLGVKDELEGNLSQWESNVLKLNGRPEFSLFEVGPKGTLLCGDVILSGVNGFAGRVKGFKPGIWHLTVTGTWLTPDSDDSLEVFEQATARWVAFGPLIVEELSAGFLKPSLAPLSEWKIVGSFLVDSGVAGIFDKDALLNLVEHDDLQTIMETSADFLLESQVTGLGATVQMGFVVVSGDGGHVLERRKHDGQIVEFRLRPSRDGDACDVCGEDTEDTDEDDP